MKLKERVVDAVTDRIITGAALIIIAVFSGFPRGDLVMFQQMGFGVAIALLLDATIVRLALVPAAMELLGERNWYLPAWLQWLPDVQVEGAQPARARTSNRTVAPTSTGSRRFDPGGLGGSAGEGPVDGFGGLGGLGLGARMRATRSLTDRRRPEARGLRRGGSSTPSRQPLTRNVIDRGRPAR